MKEKTESMSHFKERLAGLESYVGSEDNLDAFNSLYEEMLNRAGEEKERATDEEALKDALLKIYMLRRVLMKQLVWAQEKYQIELSMEQGHRLKRRRGT
ncbi:MAG: hypothetical protein JXQ25_03555 [Deltaproteobacteria bacterium]|nr:hypothetical protein [Deltaproteobacteria bacterium]